MLEAVPEGAALLARLRYPFVLDFRRHTIFVANYPGGSSPPQGMPSFQGGESLAQYLCGQSVRHVACSYRKEADLSRRLHWDRLDPAAFPWIRAQAMHTFDSQDNLMELGRTRRRIFDNGDVFVLDLGVSATGEDLGCVPIRERASVARGAGSSVSDTMRASIDYRLLVTITDPWGNVTTFERPKFAEPAATAARVAPISGARAARSAKIPRTSLGARHPVADYGDAKGCGLVVRSGSVSGMDGRDS